jgi:hypothetical protein
MSTAKQTTKKTPSKAKSKPGVEISELDFKAVAGMVAQLSEEDLATWLKEDPKREFVFNKMTEDREEEKKHLSWAAEKAAGLVKGKSLVAQIRSGIVIAAAAVGSIGGCFYAGDKAVTSYRNWRNR